MLLLGPLPWLLCLAWLPAWAIDLQRLNLANSGIESIEHITMNPSPEQYQVFNQQEYYGDYIDLSTLEEERDEDYDHVGNIMEYFDEKFVYPTLGKEELNLSIGPMALTVAEIGDFTKEFGTYIGDFKAHSHNIRGHVYIVDKNHLFIRKFSYDGGGSLDAYFWVGSDKQPSPKGQVVPHPPHEGFDSITGRPLPILEMRGQNVLLPLPQGRFQGQPLDISEIKWLSIWCTRFTVNLAEIFLPDDPKVPRPMSLERFPKVHATDLHTLRSDVIQILDKKTFYIPNFHLFVAGQRGYRFQASRREQPDKFNIDIPNENNRYDDLVDYSGRDILISLPHKTTVYDIKFFAVVDTIKGHVLGKVHIPSENELEQWPVPPARGQHQQWWPEQTPPTPPAHPPRRRQDLTTPRSNQDLWAPVTDPTPAKRWTLPNCREFLGRKVRVMWESGPEDIYFRVQAKTREDEFAALGFVPSDGRKDRGLGADYVKIFMNTSMAVSQKEQTIRAVDAFQSEEYGCTLATGFCEDEKQRGGKQDIVMVWSDRQADVTTVDFVKLRRAMDEYDTEISRARETMVLIAIGSLNVNLRDKAMVHGENESIDFNSKVPTDCFNALPVDQEESVRWKVPLRIKKSARNFEARLGPPGGDRGYKAVTGQDPPFIDLCWWINNLLLPELTVYRGQTYYFKVQGGDSDKLGSVNYHPFYITSSRDGGYGKKTESEKRTEAIWAGVEEAIRYEPIPTAKGSLCYYKPKHGGDKWREAETFRSYRDSLEVLCEEGSRENYGLLNWTVAQGTPDLVYYQSYTYEGLGWKINVLDAGASSSPPLLRLLPLLLLLLSLLLLL